MTIKRQFLFFAVLIAASVLLGNGCQSPCTYPDPAIAHVRIVNAMTDVPKVTVFIGNKLFKKDFTYDPPGDFGYYTMFADGTPLGIGDSLLFVITKDAAGKDTIMKQRVTLDLHYQTVIVSGHRVRKDSSTPDTRTIVRTIDNDIPPDGAKTLIRFTHVVPDLPGIDVYMRDTSKSPDRVFLCSLNYGQFTDHLPLPHNDGILVTEKGNPDNVIIEINTPFNIGGFFANGIVRGSSKPVDSEPVTTAFVLSDQPIGNFILDFSTAAVRFVNGMRDVSPLSLLVTNPPDVNDCKCPIPRNQVPGQAPVLNIGSDSVSHYFPVGVAPLGKTIWYFSRDIYADTVHSFPDTLVKNIRHTMVAVEGMKLGQSGLSISHLIITDTMSNTVGDSARVMIANISPDHTNIIVTVAGKQMTMKQKDLGYFTLPWGTHTVTFDDGASQGNYTLTLKTGSRPISLFILPDKIAKKYPVAVSDE
jgi:hypothetical protein